MTTHLQKTWSWQPSLTGVAVVDEVDGVDGFDGVDGVDVVVEFGEVALGGPSHIQNSIWSTPQQSNMARKSSNTDFANDDSLSPFNFLSVDCTESESSTESVPATAIPMLISASRRSFQIFGR